MMRGLSSLTSPLGGKKRVLGSGRLKLSRCMLIMSCLMLTLLVVGYWYSTVLADPANKVMKFEVCGGLTNQRIALMQGILLAAMTGRKVVLPLLKTSYRNDLTELVEMETIYDVDYLIRELKDLVEIVKEREIELSAPWLSAHINEMGLPISHWETIFKYYGPIHADCAFNSVSVLKSPKHRGLLWRISDALRFHPQFHSAADAIIEKLPKEYIALHYRVENDWVEHCKTWKGGTNCFSNTDNIANTFLLNHVPPLPVYVAGFLQDEHIRKLNTLRENHVIIDKSSFIPLINSHLPSIVVKENEKEKVRDLMAIIDFLICQKSSYFVGNSVSTFSAFIELSRHGRGEESFHYNGQSFIPLANYIPPQPMIKRLKRLKWVFTMVLGACDLLGKREEECKDDIINPEYIEMAKVAVYTAKKHTKLEIVCIALIDSKVTNVARELMSWLEAHGVTIIKHTPKWAHRFVDMYNNGNFEKNIGYSHLYASPVSLIATFMRIDIPIIGKQSYSFVYVLC